MLIKTLVLDGNKSVLQILRDLIDGFINTVGTGGSEPLGLSLIVRSIDNGCVTRRLYIFRGNIRGGCR